MNKKEREQMFKVNRENIEAICAKTTEFTLNAYRKRIWLKYYYYKLCARYIEIYMVQSRELEV